MWIYTIKEHTRKFGKFRKQLKVLHEGTFKLSLIFQFFIFAKLSLVFASSYRYVNRGDIFYLWIENKENRAHQTKRLWQLFSQHFGSLYKYIFYFGSSLIHLLSRSESKMDLQSCLQSCRGKSLLGTKQIFSKPKEIKTPVLQTKSQKRKQTRFSHVCGNIILCVLFLFYYPRKSLLDILNWEGKVHLVLRGK